MTPQELKSIVQKTEKVKAESNTLEVKSAHKGCPKRLYDTLSSFSNQDEGGILLFGLDEENDFARVGVYDAQDLQKKVTEQCNQMEPFVRPLFTVLEEGGLLFVSAEIPAVDLAQRPCFYRGIGRVKGSYTRVGDADLPMTEYEIYSYEAYRQRYQDDVQGVPRASLQSLDERALGDYLQRLKREKPNLARLDDRRIYDLMSIFNEGKPTLAALLLFCPYPQAYFPQLCITAVSVPGEQVGDLGAMGERFYDNRRIEGDIATMLEEALNFVRVNTRTRTVVDPETGRRMDRGEFPATAVREIILNALVHRDYSVHTQGMPIQVLLFADRLEVKNPGGLYGRLRIDQLGKTQPDTRNPVLATAMEVLGMTENRYSGIPTVYREMREAGLPAPVFAVERGNFVACLRRAAAPSAILDERSSDLLKFCQRPRTRAEIAEHLGVKTPTYAIRQYVQPLVDQGLIALTAPNRPSSSKQRFFAK